MNVGQLQQIPKSTILNIINENSKWGNARIGVYSSHKEVHH